MNDYNALIKELKTTFTQTEIYPMFSGPYYSFEPKIFKQAADAIDQLVKERDEWIIAYDGAQRAYHEWFAEAQKLMNERDTAIKALKAYGGCQLCKHYGEKDFCSIECGWDTKWEWKGVQE